MFLSALASSVHGPAWVLFPLRPLELLPLIAQRHCSRAQREGGQGHHQGGQEAAVCHPGGNEREKLEVLQELSVRTAPGPLGSLDSTCWMNCGAACPPTSGGWHSARAVRRNSTFSRSWWRGWGMWQCPCSTPRCTPWPSMRPGSPQESLLRPSQQRVHGTSSNYNIVKLLMLQDSFFLDETGLLDSEKQGEPCLLPSSRPSWTHISGKYTSSCPYPHDQAMMLKLFMWLHHVTWCSFTAAPCVAHALPVVCYACSFSIVPCTLFRLWTLYWP